MVTTVWNTTDIRKGKLVKFWRMFQNCHAMRTFPKLIYLFFVNLTSLSFAFTSLSIDRVGREQSVKDVEENDRGLINGNIKTPA